MQMQSIKNADKILQNRKLEFSSTWKSIYFAIFDSHINYANLYGGKTELYI